MPMLHIVVIESLDTLHIDMPSTGILSINPLHLVSPILAPLRSSWETFRLWKRCSGGGSWSEANQSANLPNLKTNPVIWWMISCIVWPESRPKLTTHVHTICSQHEYPQPLSFWCCRRHQRIRTLFLEDLMLYYTPRSISTTWKYQWYLEDFSLDDTPNLCTPLANRHACFGLRSSLWLRGWVQRWFVEELKRMSIWQSRVDLLHLWRDIRNSSRPPSQRCWMPLSDQHPSLIERVQVKGSASGEYFFVQRHNDNEACMGAMLCLNLTLNQFPQWTKSSLRDDCLLLDLMRFNQDDLSGSLSRCGSLRHWQNSGEQFALVSERREEEAKKEFLFCRPWTIGHLTTNVLLTMASRKQPISEISKKLVTIQNCIVNLTDFGPDELASTKHMHNFTIPYS